MSAIDALADAFAKVIPRDKFRIEITTEFAGADYRGKRYNRLVRIMIGETEIDIGKGSTAEEAAESILEGIRKNGAAG